MDVSVITLFAEPNVAVDGPKLPRDSCDVLVTMGSLSALFREAIALAKTLALGFGALLFLSGVLEPCFLAALAGDGSKVDRLWSMASSSFALSATIVLVVRTPD